MKTGRSVVITGAAGGFGAVFVRRFLGNGDTVFATDHDESGLAALAEMRDCLVREHRAAFPGAGI